MNARILAGGLLVPLAKRFLYDISPGVACGELGCADVGGGRRIFTTDKLPTVGSVYISGNFDSDCSRKIVFSHQVSFRFIT